MRRKGILLGIIIGLTIGLTMSAVPAGTEEEEVKALVDDFFRPMAWLVQQVDSQYVEKVSHRDMLEGAYQGLLSALDPYCVYWPPEMLKEFRDDVKGEFGGLGIQIRFDPTKKVVEVEQPIAGTPAARKGILAGDLIIEGREESTGESFETKDFKNVHDAVSALRGEPGTKITVTILHGSGREKEEITITREVIDIPGVRSVQIIDRQQGIGYVYIPYFGETVVSDLKQAIGDLQERGARGLILDLRLNPGGTLPAAEQVADLFLKEGTIVSVEERGKPLETHRSSPTAPFGDLPLVLLVNRYSASGAEIVAAALRDNGRAPVVGETTYGKGTVQTIIGNPTMPGTAVKLTIARFYTPTGELIREKGVAPSPGAEVELKEEEARDLIRNLSAKTDYPPRAEEAAEEGEEGEEKAPFVDKQLQKARALLSEQLRARAAPVAQVRAAAGG